MAFITIKIEPPKQKYLLDDYQPVFKEVRQEIPDMATIGDIFEVWKKAMEFFDYNMEGFKLIKDGKEDWEDLIWQD